MSFAFAGVLHLQTHAGNTFGKECVLPKLKPAKDKRQFMHCRTSVRFSARSGTIMVHSTNTAGSINIQYLLQQGPYDIQVTASPVCPCYSRHFVKNPAVQ
jgi:hypothetical protein